MMKANELMSGFYVRLNKDGISFEKGQILKVLSITYYQYFTSTAKCEDESGYVCIVGVDCLDPIPLTEDILKKIGFEKTKLVVNSYILEERFFTLFAKEINDGAWYIDVLNNEFNLPGQSAIVFHVHQLQQWLRFCGIEREITIDCLTK